MSFWGLSSLLPSSVRGKRTNQDDADLLKRKSRRRTANSGEHDDDDDSASHGGPLPVNLANPLHTPLSTDARWDLAINPTSAEFAAVHRAFWLLLRDPGQTVQGIVEQHFTAFERDLLLVRRGGQGGKGKGISGGGRNDDGEDVEVQQAIGSVARAPRGLDGETALVGLRAVNGWRYIELMQTKKFQEALKAENAANAANGEEGDGNKGGDVALRLAMAWFGLPVAALNGPEEEDEPANGGTQRTGLEFLAEYVDRTYAGRDFTDSKRDLDQQIRQLQRRYGEREHGASQRPVALRGGSVSVGPSSPGDEPEVLNKADQMSVLSKENRRHYKTKQPPTSKRNKRDDDQAQRSVALIYGKNPEQPTRKDTKTPALSYRWVPLYGYQGKVYFRSDLPRTFVDAVDRLLCLDNRVGVAYTVYLFDRRKPYASDPQLRAEFMRNPTKNGITIWAAGPGDYSHDTLAWKFIRENVLDTPDDDEDSACKVLFVAGPDDPIPWIWEPQLEHRVLRVMAKSLDPPVEERPDDARDVAYLRVPRDEDGWLLFTNQYAPWVANLCRVLTPGRLILRPGRPAVPDAWFTMDECTVGMYGGLVCPFAMWVEWAGQWSPSGPNEVELLVMAAPENATGVSDRWHLFMAGATGGYEDNYILHDEVESAARSHDRIVKLVEESISSVACERLDSIEVYLPGQRIALQGTGGDAPVLSMGLSRSTSSVYAFRQVYQHLITWKRWLESQPSAGLPKQHNGLGEYPQFIGLYPVYSEYTVIDRERTREPVRWYPKTSTVAEFRDIARDLIGLPPREEIEDDGSDEADRLRNPWIAVTQGRNEDPIMDDDELDLGPLDAIPDFHKPILVLGPHTGEAEWKAMCKLIVEPEVQVSEIVRESHPLLLYGNPTIEQPFGYRDIYATPKEHLYFALTPDQIPIHQRHYDYQMEGRMQGNAFQRLHPWDVQPWPLSDIYALERFPMRLPPGSAEAEGIQQVTAGKLTASSLLDKIPTKAVSASMAQTARGGTKKGAKTGRTVAEPETNAGANTSAAANVNTSANANSNTNPNAGDNNTQARSERLASANPLGMELTTTPTTPEATTSHNILNLGHNTVPRVSLSVLTPSEVRQLQQDYRNLRKSVLYREERCPYFGCPAKFPRRELDRLQRHLHERHVVRRCNFCDAPERPNQSVGERMAHMREKHMEVLRAMVAEADGLDPGATRTRGAAASKAEKAKPAPKLNKRKRPQKKPEIEVVGPRVKRRRREESEEESEAEESSDLSSAPTSNHSRDSTGEFRPVSQRRGDGQPKPARTAKPELAKPTKADKAPSEIIPDSSDEESDVPAPGTGSLSMATRPRATPSQLAASPRTSSPGSQPQPPASRPAQPAPNPSAAATTTTTAAAAGSGRRPKPKTTADKGIDLPNHSDTPSRSMPKLSHPHRKPPRPSPPAEWFQSSSPARSPTPSPAPAPVRARTPTPVPTAAPAAAPAPAPVPVPKAVPVSNTTKTTRTPVPTSRASPKPESPPKKAPATRRVPRRAAVTSAQKTAETLKPKPKPKAKGNAKAKKDDGK